MKSIDLDPCLAEHYPARTWVTHPRAGLLANAIYGKYGDKPKGYKFSQLGIKGVEAFKAIRKTFNTKNVGIIVRSFHDPKTKGDCLDLKDGKQLIRLSIRLKDEDDLLTTLAHELIHADQMQRGDLKINGNGTVVWKGVEYEAVSPKNNYDKYRNFPWEKEARDGQEILKAALEKLLF